MPQVHLQTCSATHQRCLRRTGLRFAVGPEGRQHHPAAKAGAQAGGARRQHRRLAGQRCLLGRCQHAAQLGDDLLKGGAVVCRQTTGGRSW